MFQEGLITDDEGEAVFLGFDSPQEEDDTVLGFDFKEEDDLEPINEVSFFFFIFRNNCISHYRGLQG